MPTAASLLIAGCGLELGGNGLIDEFSTEAYKDCDRLASQILRMSYEDAAEEGGRFVTFLTREKGGRAMLYRLNDQDKYEVINDDDVIAKAVYGDGFWGLVAIKAAQETKGKSGESIAEIVAKSAMPEDSDPRLVLKTNSSLVCKIKFSSLGALPPGFYRVGEDEDSYYYEQVDTD